MASKRNLISTIICYCIIQIIFLFIIIYNAELFERFLFVYKFFLICVCIHS